MVGSYDALNSIHEKPNRDSLYPFTFSCKYIFAALGIFKVVRQTVDRNLKELGETEEVVRKRLVEW